MAALIERLGGHCVSENHRYSGQLTWVEGLEFVAHSRQTNASFVLDGAREFGGSDAAVRPMEALLLSLAGCTAMDVISILSKKRQRVTGFHVNVEGTQAEEHPRRFVRIELEYILRGHDLSDRAVARSIELSQTKYCGVTASLNSQVTYTYRIESEAGFDTSV